MNANSKFAAHWSAKSLLLATSALSFAVLPTAAMAQTATTTATTEEDQDNEAAPESQNPDTTPAPGDAIVVTGIRRSLETARNIKRNSDTFVDSITASDVSTLPDLSVAEALGRVPGVSVSRFPSGGASPDFPSPEGRGNLIRGLGYVRSEFNGRDAFTANAGRALDWSAIPPELVGAVDVFKNQTADLIEGGIGGTINLRTLEPFDRKDRFIAAALDFTYSDLRESWSPSGSITAGDRWQTGAGEFGLIASYSKSLLDSRIHGWQQNAPTPRVLSADGTFIPQAGQFTGANRLNEFAGVDPSRIIGTTSGFQMRTNDVDRDRTSYYGAAQWQSNDDRIKATAKYVRAKTDIDSIERTYEWWPDHDPSANMGITELVVNPNFQTEGTPLCNGAGGFPSNPGDCETLIPIGGGLMEAGLVTNNSESWTGVSGVPLTSLGIGKKEEAMTQDISLNLQWEMTDRLSANFDGHKTRATARSRQLWAGLSNFANFRINHDLDNPYIEIVTIPGNTFNPGNTRLTTDTAANPIPSAVDTADPNGYNLLYASEFYQEGDGDLYALRGDFNYDLTGGDGAASWFDAIKFGARYSERSQENREFGDNWGGLAPAWAGGYGIVGTFQDQSLTEAVDFSDFFRGGVVGGTNTQFRFVSEDYLNDYSAFREYLLAEPQIGTNHPWAPRLEADGTVWGKANFLPQHISDITEKTRNAYVRADFGNEFGNEMSLTGNVGVRYVRTDLNSSGFRSFRRWNDDAVQPVFVDGVRRRTDDAESRDDQRDFLPAAALYTEQAAIPVDFKIRDTYWLPSFNAKFNLNREMLIRFGASKGLSRPDIQNLRAAQEYTVVTSRTAFPPIIDRTDPLFGIDRGAQNITLSQVRVGRGNPQLKPTTAWNYDLSYEYYFKGGYFSAATFLKKLKNIQVNGELSLGTETIGGVEVPLIYSGLINQAKARVRGFEIAHQQFYDFLPGILGNFGTQANYTFVDAKTTPPPSGVDADNDGNIDAGQTAVYRYGVDDMLGQSKHLANLVGIYQDEKLELRLAYNWRSKYLTTYRDYVTGAPVFVSAAGFLDASAKYQFTPQLQVRASIANLLDTKSKARGQIDQDGQLYDRFSFLNDRRFVFGVLAQF